MSTVPTVERPAYSFEDRFLPMTDGVAIHYRIVYLGDNSPYTVLIEPGSSLAYDYLMPCAEHFAATGLRSCLWNPRGTGKLESGRWSGGYFDINKYMKDRKALVKMLRDYGPVFSFSHSLAGTLAIKQQLIDPAGVSGIVAIESPDNPRVHAEKYMFLHRTIKNPLGRRLLRTMALNPVLKYAGKIGRRRGRNNFFETLGNLRTEGNFITYHELRLPVTEEDYQISTKIIEDGANCGSVSELLEERKPRKMPPVLFIGGTHDGRIPLEDVRSVYETANNLGYRAQFDELGMDHRLDDHEGNGMEQQLTDRSREFYDEIYDEIAGDRKSRLPKLALPAAAAVASIALLYGGSRIYHRRNAHEAHV